MTRQHGQGTRARVTAPPRGLMQLDFDQAPFVVAWELTHARAYAFTGDWLAEEPCCVYQPVAA